MGKSYFDIWQPRWKDRMVLLATYKVADENIITFSKTPSLKGTYRISGEEVKKCHIRPEDTTQARRIPRCYEVPLSKLEKIGEDKNGN